ncbi:MAG: hypothetical protein ACM3SY_13960 [Candidatus Omnitrophota bacterium]
MTFKRYKVFTSGMFISLFIMGFVLMDAHLYSSLKLDKTTFAPGERISVHFTAGPGFADNAWIGIIPSSVAHGSEMENDKYDITYQYLNGKQSGTLTFKAPAQPGSYDFRMHDTDNNGREIASVSFQVGGSTGNLSLSKSRVGVNEEIRVSFTAGPGFADNAWIGMIPSSVAHGSETENDKYDLTYQYLNGKQSGTLIFQAPAQPGNYDFRMHDTDNNGKEIASVSFQVIKR